MPRKHGIQMLMKDGAVSRAECVSAGPACPTRRSGLKGPFAPISGGTLTLGVEVLDPLWIAVIGMGMVDDSEAHVDGSAGLVDGSDG